LRAEQTQTLLFYLFVCFIDSVIIIVVVILLFSYHTIFA